MATSTTTLRNGPLFPSKASTAPAVPATRPRPYKDFLTASLHRRFTSAAVLIFLVCYVEALFLRWPGLLWFWNPLSLAGARACLLFTACLAVFIVRVANLHVGPMTTTSSAETVYRRCTSLSTLVTLGWYVYSGMFFGEIYIWSRGEEANLGWVDYGNAYERPRLNENPIYLRSVFLCLSIAQAGLHLMGGYDRILVPEKVRGQGLEAQAASHPPIPKSFQEALQVLRPIGYKTLQLAIPGIAFSLPVYFVFIRSFAWHYFQMVARVWFRDLPSNARPTGLSHVVQLFWQAISSGFLLIMLWELSNTAFTIFVSLPPLKKEQPLTSEVKDAAGNVVSKSQDPNGSLLSGLKSTKEVPKSFAFWELWLLCDQFEARRKTIYSEVDRADGSTWSQISISCLTEIERVKERIVVSQIPLEADDAARRRQEEEAAQKQKQAAGLPRIGDRAVHQDGNVFQPSSKNNFAHSVGNAAKSMGQSPGSPNPVGPYARKAIDWSANRMLSKEEQARLSRAGISKEANTYAKRFLGTPIGEPFREIFARRVRAVIFGVPHSAKVNILHASRALVKLAVCSLREDDFGQVAKSVAQIIRAHVRTITEVETFVAGLPPSWTDVQFSPQDRRVPEVEELVGVLREGLEEVLLAFAEYAPSIGVTKKDLREAREALGKGSEMIKV